MANTRPFWNVLGISLYLLLLLLWGLSVFLTPGDKNMGEIYRIIYVHVPVAFAAFFSAFLLLVFSVLGLWKRSFGALFWGRACSEVGLLFTVLTLITGSIWGYPTWGTWWTWDARLTTTLILAILYGGYLLLYNSIPSKRQRLSVCSFLGVIIFINVIIVYKSVTWWRTLHQPPTFFQKGQSFMAWETKAALIGCVLAILLLEVWLLWKRSRNLFLRDEFEKSVFKEVLG